MAEDKKKEEAVVEDKEKELNDLRTSIAQVVTQYQQLEARYTKLVNAYNWVFNQYLTGGETNGNQQ